VNTALRHASAAAQADIYMRDIASRNYTLVHMDDIVFNIIEDMWRRETIMAVVVRELGLPLISDVVGVISKEHVADSVSQ
jgi:CIC family chloride channel protein